MKIDARLFLIIVLNVNDFGHTYTREDVMTTQRRHYETKSNLNLFDLMEGLLPQISAIFSLLLMRLRSHLLTIHVKWRKNIVWTTPR